METWMTIIDAAVKYASRGLYIFPVTPNAKIPLTSHGCKDATTNISTVRAWWERWPNANIGMATGNDSQIVVLDYDCKHDKPGLKTFESIQSRFGIISLTAETPSGGIHQF